MKKTPKYAQIEAELIAQIESGQLAPGAELPSESDLIECYGVSRVTVRRAIDELYHQGYVEKMQGKRACVKEKVKLQELTSISSYTEEIIRQGMTPSRKLLSFGLRVCTKEEAEQLGLKKADPVFFMERIYFADGSPLCLTSTVLPYQLFREIGTKFPVSGFGGAISYSDYHDFFEIKSCLCIRKYLPIFECRRRYAAAIF